MQPNHRYPTSILVFTLPYVATIGLPALRSGKPELVSDLLMKAILITAISIVNRRGNLSLPLLAGTPHRAGRSLRGSVGISFRNRQDTLPIYAGQGFAMMPFRSERHSYQKAMKTFSENRIPAIPARSFMEAGNSLIGRLRNSELFRSYREIFRNSTGLPLDLRSVGARWLESGLDHAGGSRFCRLMNSGGNLCPQCAEAYSCLSPKEGRSVRSVRCFAGLVETAVPVMHGGTVVAQLMTGHVFHEKATRERFAEIMGMVGEDAELERAYLETPVIGEEKYRAMTILLAAFSLQLGELAGQIVLDLRQEKSDCIACAKDFIDENIHDPILLDEVASEVHISRYYLCRRFKQATGMTLTEYVTARRVEMAKEMLMNTSLRVADIAFEAGFQSLSQFNRCFRNITRITPMEFRRSESDSRSPAGQNRMRGFRKSDPN
jgi:AraC-like DNA-binding protein